MTRKAKVGILSLGCPRNLVDSEGISGNLNLKGYRIVDVDKADIAIVNTCGFIDEAKRESIEAILDLAELKKEGRLKKIIVYGCLPQRYKDELRRRLPEVDAFVGRVSLEYSTTRFPIIPKHYAYLKICEGCVNYCSYCVIPKIKGRLESLDIDTLLKKVSSFDKEKISELNIIGQDITGYGFDFSGVSKLPKLMKRINSQIKHIPWIRLLYLYPSRVSDELLQIIKDSPRICKYIDLPIQHINERILKLMNRNTSPDDLRRLIEKIRKKIPRAALRTSVMVGFPSESQKEFQELLRFIKEARFERLGAFIYSREEGTPAYSLDKQLPQKIKNERFAILMSVQQGISKENNSKLLGEALDVLIDEEDKEGGQYLGRTQYDAPEVDGIVYVSSKKKLYPGDIIRVKISDTLEYDLVGEAVS